MYPPMTLADLLSALLMLGVVVALFALTLVSFWKVFEKMGQPGWTALIPFYSTAKMLEMTNRPLWWMMLTLIPVVNLCIYVNVFYRLAQCFGRGKWFAVGMVFLPFIFIPILAFGTSTYSNTFLPAQPMSEATKWSLIILGFTIISWYMFAGQGYLERHHILAPIAGGDGSSYMTDGSYIYTQDKLIVAADVNTFSQIKDSYYAKDLYHVYYGGVVILNEVPLTFKALEGDYAVGTRGVYFEGIAITGADPSTFTINDSYDQGLNYDALDKNNFYSSGVIVDKAKVTNSLQSPLK